MSSFQEMALPKALQHSLDKMKFTTPTEIQKKAIPIALKGQDVIACAQTGTGKTAAFSIPLVVKALENPNSKFLVLAPTRELASQIQDVILELTQAEKRLRSILLVGGAPIRRQLEKLKKRPQIIIATPGRLNDHLKRKSIQLDRCHYCVLDEADRMLDMGFGPQIDEVFQFMPAEKQVLLFSATISKSIEKLASRLVQNPIYIETDNSHHSLKKIQQEGYFLEPEEKNDRLVEVLFQTGVKTIVFTQTKRGADRLEKFLRNEDISTACIHGDKNQGQRERAMRRFRKEESAVLVATDVAARGIDISDVELVVNFDLPDNAEDYTHRIGRTGRADREGLAISFVSPSEAAHWRYLQNPKDPQAKKRSNKRGGRFQNKAKSFGRKKNFKKSYRPRAA